MIVRDVELKKMVYMYLMHYCDYDSTCRELALDCATADPETNVYAACCDDAIPKTLQERAWTSPIWYVPE